MTSNSESQVEFRQHAIYLRNNWRKDDKIWQMHVSDLLNLITVNQLSTQDQIDGYRQNGTRSIGEYKTGDFESREELFNGMMVAEMCAILLEMSEKNQFV